MSGTKIQMGSLQPLHRHSTQNESTNSPISSSSSNEIEPADTSPNPADLHQAGDATVHFPQEVLATSSPPQNRLVSKECLWSVLRSIIIYFISVTFSPFLVVFCLILRLLQFVRHGRGYYIVTQLKLLIRIRICQALSVTCLIMLIPVAIQPLPFGDILWKPVQVLIICVPLLAGSVLPTLLCILIPYYSPFDYVGFYFRERALEITDCLLFAFCIFFLDLFQTQIWVKVSLSVIAAYNVISLITCLIVLSLQKLVPRMLGPSISDTRLETSLGGKYIVYCTKGMKYSINFILIALMVLLTWVLYCSSYLKDTPNARKILEIGTRTCVSVLICSAFWLIKTVVLLIWEATAVYNRLSSELLDGGNHLYFLGLISRHKHNIFNILYDVTRQEVAPDPKQDKLGVEGKMQCRAFIKRMIYLFNQFDDVFKEQKKLRSLKNGLLAPSHEMLRALDNYHKSESDKVDEWPKQGALSAEDENQEAANFKVKKLSSKMKRRVRYDLIMEDDRHGLTPTIHGIQQVALYLLSARKVLSKETFTSDVLHFLEEGSEDGKMIKENLLKQLIDGENDETQESSKGLAEGELKHSWDCLKAQLNTNSEEIELETIRAWMDRARNNCLFLANTLSSAKEVAECLDKIISLFIIAATLVIWLLLTGFATTKVFVLIASPLLAATFIFGESCKFFFQGIMFVYVVHPFHIGDLCVINEKMMEVRTVGVWKTTFLRVGTRAEVIFTNTELSKKHIVNYKTEFDWNDSLELEVASLDTEQIRELKQKIETHLNVGKENFKSSNNCVTVLTTGSNIKIDISIQHNVDVKTLSYHECVKEKQKRLSELALDVHDLFEKMQNSTTRENATDGRNKDGNWNGT